MRLIIFLLITTLSHTLAFPSRALNPAAHFETYVKTYAKDYNSLEERERRFNVFAKNLREIEEFNERAESQNIPFKLGVNSFTELEYDEFVSIYTGLRYDSNMTDTNEVNEKKPLFMSKILAAYPPPSKGL